MAPDRGAETEEVLLVVSELVTNVRPGRTHDLTAARAHGVVPV